MKRLKIFSVCFVLLFFAYSQYAVLGQEITISDLSPSPSIEGKDIGNSTVTYVDPEFYVSGEENTIRLGILADSPDWEYLVGVVAEFPEGWDIISITQEGTDWDHDIEDNIATWGVTDGNWSSGQGYIYNAEEWFEAIIDIPADASGTQTIVVDLFGDNFGSPPHEVLGIEVDIYELAENIYIMPEESYGSVCSGDSFDLMLQLWNNTDETLDIAFDYTAPMGYYLEFDPELLVVGPGDTEDFMVTVLTPGDAPDGATEEIIINAYPTTPRNDIEASAYIYATTFTGFYLDMLADMNEARGDHAAAVYDGLIYVFGGVSGVVLYSLEIYDPETDTWDFGTPLSADLVGDIQSPKAGAAVDGYILFQNDASDQWPIYNIADDSWSVTTSPFGSRFAGNLTACNNGLIYASGGIYNEAVRSNFYSYDILTDTWTELEDIPHPVYFHSSFAHNGSIYIAGGLDGDFELDSVFVYNISDDEWDTAEPLPQTIWGAASGVIGEFFLIGGGVQDDDFSNTIYSYHIGTGDGDTLDIEFAEEFFRGASATLNGNIYAIGNWNWWDGDSYVQVIGSCEDLEGPDASIDGDDITYSPSDPMPGDTVSITARIHNVGTEDITEGDAEFYYSMEPWEDLQLITIESFGVIPAGDYIDITIDWDTDENLDPTIYIITVFLENIMPEDVNLDNNSAYTELALPVELAYFTAIAIGNRATLRWKTLSETDNLGFNLYRINMNTPGGIGLPVKLNDSIIPGQGTSSNPTSYSFVDHGINRLFDYVYILETVSTTGETEEYQTGLMRVGFRQIVF